ncbi:hypothetical protein CsSME_00016559 [Camellia sinensis var. sinensis]
MLSRGRSFDRASGGAHFRTFPSCTQNRDRSPNCSKTKFAPSPKGGGAKKIIDVLHLGRPNDSKAELKEKLSRRMRPILEEANILVLV